MVVFAIFAMAEVFVLLLGEIDLSIVYNAGIGAALMAAFVAGPYNFPWWRRHLDRGGHDNRDRAGPGYPHHTAYACPAFIVTLAGFLGFEGVMLWLFGRFSIALGGSIPITNKVLTDLVAGSITPLAGWVTMAVLVVAFGDYNVIRNMRLRASGLVTAARRPDCAQGRGRGASPPSSW